MKKLALLLIGICLSSCSNKKTNVETENDSVSKNTIKHVQTKVIDTAFEIVPGERIGFTKIGENVINLAKLGKADISDSAMGKSWSTWISKKNCENKLSIFSAYKDSGMTEKVVYQIRVTSSRFQTAEGVSTQKSLQEIQKVFTDIKLTEKITDEETGNLLEIYESEKNGISFDFFKNECVAIRVYSKGKKLKEVGNIPEQQSTKLF